MNRVVTAPNGDGKIEIDAINADKVSVIGHVENFNAPRPEKQKPHQGPKQPPSVFIGRTQALDDLVDLLDLGGKNPGVVTVKGMGGVGKTTLVQALKHDARVQEALPNGVLWASLGPKPDLEHIASTWAAALGMDLRAYRSLGERLDYLSSLVAPDRILIVLDDIWSPEDARPLLIGGTDSRTVISTRDDGVARGLDSRQVLELRSLDQPASIELLEANAPGAYLKDRAGILDLVEELGGLPLALTLVGGILKSNLDAELDLSLLLEELHQRRARLSIPGLSAAGATLEAVLRLSYDSLPDEATRMAFRLLGAFGGGSLHFSLGAAAAVWQANPLQAQKFMVLLVGRHLAMPIQSRFVLHSLLADFAVSLLTPEEAQQTADLHARYFLDIARKYRSTDDWSTLDIDWRNLRRVADRMSSNGTESEDSGLFAISSEELIADYFSALNFVVQVRKPVESSRWLEAGVEACRRLNRLADQGWLMLTLGRIAIDDGDLEKAREIFASSYEVFSQAPEPTGQLYSEANLGVVHQVRGDYDEALSSFRHAVLVSEEKQDDYSTAIGHYNIGDVLDRQGHKEQALAELATGQACLKRLGHEARDKLALVDCRLAGVQVELGMLDQALALCQEATVIAQEVKSPPVSARVQAAWSLYWTALREDDKAEPCFKESLEICRTERLTEELAETLESYGYYLIDRKKTEQGCEQLIEACENFRRLGANGRIAQLEATIQTIRNEG